MAVGPPYDARAVSNFLLDLSDQRRIGLTQVSLMKILYFSHGWYLCWYNISLIRQDFEAWEYGPVVKVVRDEFKICKTSIIRHRAKKLDIYSGEYADVKVDLDDNDKLFVSNIFDSYHVYDAWQLSRLTHEQGSPWDILWNAKEPVGRVALRLKNEDIRRYFSMMSKHVIRS